MASLVHTASAETTSSQLDLFAIPPTQTSLEGGSYTEYQPVSILSSAGPIEFVVSGESSSYIDLANSLLYVRASIVKADGTDLDGDSEIAPECNFIHSLWSQIDLYLNGTLITPSNNNYGYRCCLENLLSFGASAKKTQLTSLLWYRNQSGHFDSPNANNPGYVKRKAFAAGSNQFDMIGRIHTDLAFQNRYLLNGVELRFRLIRASDSFCLQ